MADSDRIHAPTRPEVIVALLRAVALTPWGVFLTYMFVGGVLRIRNPESIVPWWAAIPPRFVFAVTAALLILGIDLGSKCLPRERSQARQSLLVMGWNREKDFTELLGIAMSLIVTAMLWAMVIRGF